MTDTEVRTAPKPKQQMGAAHFLALCQAEQKAFDDMAYGQRKWSSNSTVETRSMYADGRWKALNRALHKAIGLMVGEEWDDIPHPAVSVEGRWFNTGGHNGSGAEVKESDE